MTLLECKNGHLVSNPDAIRCPECNEYVRQRSAPSALRETPPASGLSQGMFLVYAGPGLAVLAGIILAISQGNGFGMFLAAVAGFAASTIWLIGCIAVGVRIGRGES